MADDLLVRWLAVVLIWVPLSVSGTTSSQVDTLNQNLGAESNEPQKLLEPEEDQDDSAVSDGQVRPSPDQI